MRAIDADALRKSMFSYYDCVNEHTGKSNYRGDTLMDYEVADLIDNCIDNAPTIDPSTLRPNWISVEDRLPNYFEHVLINAPGDKPFTTVHEAHLRKDGLWDTGLYRYDREDVTHWMPMPEPLDMRGDA